LQSPNLLARADMREHRRTGSSSAWIARNGTLMASRESTDDASR
jgi:hypothetical protein